MEDAPKKHVRPNPQTHVDEVEHMKWIQFQVIDAVLVIPFETVFLIEFDLYLYTVKCDRAK